MSLEDLARSVMLGTEREAPPRAARRCAPLEDFDRRVENLEIEPEARVLMRAAALSLFETAGYLPERPGPRPGDAARPEPCEAERLRPCSDAAALLLSQILALRRDDLLTVWLRAARRAGIHAPFALLPNLLQRGASSKAIRPDLAEVLGRRGRWLARHHAPWSYALEGTDADAAASAGPGPWQEGTIQQRLAYLAALRGRSPERALELLRAALPTATAAHRARLMEALRVGLSTLDEPLLEKGLEDRSKQVRERAAELLSALPDSSRAARMRNRCRCLIARRGISPSRSALEIEAPEAFGAESQRDGLRELPAGTRSRSKGRLGPSGWRLRELVGATPMAFWREDLGLEPAEILAALPRNHPRRQATLEGLTVAALAQKDAALAQALLEDAASEIDSVGYLIAMLSPQNADVYLRGALKAAPDDALDHQMALAACHQSLEWSEELSRIVLGRLRSRVARELRRPSSGSERRDLRDFFRELGLRLHLGLAPAAVEEGWAVSHERWSNVEKGFADFVLTLNLRTRISEELAP
ncbi:MAG: DUF5691 domain-containing protein [Acidobacteriota bacterium]